MFVVHKMHNLQQVFPGRSRRRRWAAIDDIVGCRFKMQMYIHDLKIKEKTC